MDEKVIEILRVLSEANRALSSKEMAEKLNMVGYTLKERTVRYHLLALDEQGLTSKVGGKKRAITNLGRHELERVLVYERIGESIDYGAQLTSEITFDLKSGKGTVPVNIALVPISHREHALSIIKETSGGNLFCSSLIKVANERKAIGDFVIPEGVIGIACISSIIFDAVLMREGISIRPVYAGLLEVRGGKPLGFVELIKYEGTTISPSVLFIKAGFTSVLNTVRTGSGKINAAIRETSTIDNAKEVLSALQNHEIGGILEIYKSNKRTKFGVPLQGRKTGVITLNGNNLLAPLLEVGFATKLYVSNTLMDYSELRTP